MAIDIFREGMQGYLNEQREKQSVKSAQELQQAIDCLNSGSIHPKDLRRTVVSATEELVSKTDRVGRLIDDVGHFTRRLMEELVELGIALPPAEILLNTTILHRGSRA